MMMTMKMTYKEQNCYLCSRSRGRLTKSLRSDLCLIYAKRWTYAKIATKVQLTKSPRKNLCQSYAKVMPDLCRTYVRHRTCPTTFC